MENKYKAKFLKYQHKNNYLIEILNGGVNNNHLFNMFNISKHLDDQEVLAHSLKNDIQRLHEIFKTMEVKNWLYEDIKYISNDFINYYQQYIGNLETEKNKLINNINIIAETKETIINDVINRLTELFDFIDNDFANIIIDDTTIEIFYNVLYNGNHDEEIIDNMMNAIFHGNIKAKDIEGSSIDILNSIIGNNNNNNNIRTKINKKLTDIKSIIDIQYFGDEYKENIRENKKNINQLDNMIKFLSDNRISEILTNYIEFLNTKNSTFWQTRNNLNDLKISMQNLTSHEKTPNTCNLLYEILGVFLGKQTNLTKINSTINTITSDHKKIIIIDFANVCSTLENHIKNELRLANSFETIEQLDEHLDEQIRDELNNEKYQIIYNFLYHNLTNGNFIIIVNKGGCVNRGNLSNIIEQNLSIYLNTSLHIFQMNNQGNHDDFLFWIFATFFYNELHKRRFNDSEHLILLTSDKQKINYIDKNFTNINDTNLTNEKNLLNFTTDDLTNIEMLIYKSNRCQFFGISNDTKKYLLLFYKALTMSKENQIGLNILEENVIKCNNVVKKNNLIIRDGQNGQLTNTTIISLINKKITLGIIFVWYVKHIQFTLHNSDFNGAYSDNQVLEIINEYIYSEKINQTNNIQYQSFYECTPSLSESNRSDGFNTSNTSNRSNRSNPFNPSNRSDGFDTSNRSNGFDTSNRSNPSNTSNSKKRTIDDNYDIEQPDRKKQYNSYDDNNNSWQSSSIPYNSGANINSQNRDRDRNGYDRDRDRNGYDRDGYDRYVYDRDRYDRNRHNNSRR